MITAKVIVEHEKKRERPTGAGRAATAAVRVGALFSVKPQLSSSALLEEDSPPVSAPCSAIWSSVRLLSSLSSLFVPFTSSSLDLLLVMSNFPFSLSVDSISF